MYLEKCALTGGGISGKSDQTGLNIKEYAVYKEVTEGRKRGVGTQSKVLCVLNGRKCVKGRRIGWKGRAAIWCNYGGKNIDKGAKMKTWGKGVCVSEKKRRIKPTLNLRNGRHGLGVYTG